MPSQSHLNHWLMLGVAFALVAATATVGGLASAQAPDFYRSLASPAWAPPGWVFGPVWTVLYAMMALAAWLVWRERGFAGAPLALSLFLVQLILNALWTWIFFAWRSGGAAFAEIVLLWLMILATIAAFMQVRTVAGVLLMPYAAWVTYAAALNFALWRMNPGLL